MQLGRGCNWNCRFCCNGDIRKANTGTYVRNRSVQGSIGELVEIARNFRFRCITIRDDNFAFNRQWALDFCREYPKHIRQPFEVFSRVDCLDEEVIAGLKAAGCLSVFLGLDSGHDYIRNEVLHKEQTNDDLRRVSAQLKAAGIRPVLSNIVGLPYETLEMHQQTIALNREIYSEGPYFSPSFGVTPKIWVFDPWPGTDLYKVCKKEGWLESDDRKHKVYRQSCLNMPQFRPEAIHHAYRTFRWRVFKDRYPVKALMLRIYDTRLAEEIMERLPLEYVGVVREALLRLMNKGVRRFFARKAPAALRSKPSAA
jgi:anaerobic magnesium-protoporphyrin IX monomethyl ester cyclase